MKSLVKRTVMTLYSWGWISNETVLRAFERFDLWSA